MIADRTAREFATKPVGAGRETRASAAGARGETADQAKKLKIEVEFSYVKHYRK
jgi:hypothetical protein